VIRGEEREFLNGSDGVRAGREALQLQKILVPVDFSDCSQVGLNYAIQFAREFKAKLVLFHSVFVNAFALSDEYTALEMPNLFAYQERYAKEEMRKLRKMVADHGLDVEPEIAVGVPFDQVCDYVQDKDVDLIITSTHGRPGFSHALIGSTAEHIVRHASCPVLVVPVRPAKPQLKSK
jgi:nucleotide-binding universal stress UspA family protein